MLGDFMPCLAMVLLQVGYAGMNISSKLALESGMNALVLVAYRQIFSFFAIAPFAFFMERKTRPKITMSILFQIFLCSLTGAVGNQVFYFIGLEYTTPTTASALNNALPAVTFVLAALFRLEAVGIKTVAGQAKVIGTIVCVGGSMLLSFYHGHIIAITESDIHWKYAENMNGSSSSSSSNLLGPFLVMLSCAAWAAWFIIQARLGEKFSAPYTTTALMSLMASVECVAIALIPEHTVAAWSLKSSVRVIAAIYAGVVCSALAFCLMSWCIERKGPLYVSMFSPLMLIIVAVLSWALLHEKLFVGTLVGSILIIAGLYAVLWGKGKEETKQMKSVEENVDAKIGDDDEKDDLEAGKHDNPGDMIGKKIGLSPR